MRRAGRLFAHSELPYDIVIEAPAMRTIRRHAQAMPWTRESGGQLFGTIVGWRIVVSEATVPSDADLRTRTSFVIDVPTANAQIAERTARGMSYLGDWHTHPEAHPRPSAEDTTNVARMFSGAGAPPWFVILIAGRITTWVGIASLKAMTKYEERVV